MESTSPLLSRLAFIFIAGALAAPLQGQPPAAAAKINFNRDIQPILSNNCYFCHGFDEEQRAAGLRLDTLDGATQSHAIVPGDPESSELLERINSEDPETRMPPADSAYTLTEKQKRLLHRWIAEGAEYQEHWSYQTLARPAVPDADALVPDADDLHPIDAFLQRGWRENAIVPVARDSARQVLRRLSFDLRGLPPSHEEVQRYSQSPTRETFQEFVDRWTGSIQHAEHQGLKWLDLVRWADSSGMVSDEPIATGAYRAYVIESFHNNMPFDQFTREQLAGDLLPEPGPRSLVASGYNRLVKTNSEAGVIEREALHALQGEHVRALGTVWLGATTGCAECHDHKYDPITAKDYYSLAAFFDDLIEIGVYEPGDRRHPLYFLYRDPDLTRRDQELSDRVTRLRGQLYGPEVDPAEQAGWETTMRDRLDSQPDRADFPWLPAVLPPARLSSGSYQQTESGRRSTAPPGEIALHMLSAPMTGYSKGVDDKHSHLYFDVTLDPQSPPTAIAVQIINGAYQRQGWHPEYFSTYVWGAETDLAQFQQAHASASGQPVADNRIVHVGPLPAVGEKVRLILDRNTQLSIPYEAIGVAWIQLGGTVTWGDSGYELSGRSALTAKLGESTMRYWWELPTNRDDFENKMTLVAQSLKIAPAQRRQVHRDVLRHAFAESKRPELVLQLTDAYRRLYLLRQRADEAALVSQTGPIRQSRLRLRGNFMDNSGPVVAAAVPEFLGELDADAPATRLDLANWLVSPENPLTARVFMNRLWAQFYGRGLSETLEDAGKQGDSPSHPELLDWLASEFIESGWDVRHMIQLLVSADAYQLTSVPTQTLAQSDPGNRWHARQGRHRLGAEAIRDSALAVAGLLQATKEVPTRSFFPYQPDSYWENSNKIMYGSRYQIWATDPGASQYQRSLYTFWKRQNPHPSLSAFDAPTRQECTAERAVTNTPGQALAMLNDPTFVEAARALAQAVVANPQARSTPQRVEWLFQRALQRSPSAAEQQEILELLDEVQTHFTNHPESAQQLLSVGQLPRDQDASVVDQAAWTIVCRTILNLHEFLTRS